MKNQFINWNFPAPHVHDGIPIANGVFGALIWGEKNNIKITINRADFWDHRGGNRWGKDVTFDNIAKWLKEKNSTEIDRVFKIEELNGFEKRPTCLPMGRFELVFDENVYIESADLDILNANAIIRLSNGSEKTEICISAIYDINIIHITYKGGICAPKIAQIPAYLGEVEKELRMIMLERPVVIDAEDTKGWIQKLPVDPACCTLCTKKSGENCGEVYITAVFGEDENDSFKSAQSEINKYIENKQEYYRATKRYWNEYWEKGASLEIPDSNLEKVYYMGMYKFGAVGTPNGIPVSLQGPWVEDHMLPPWSNDYHFNINVQECYWPAYGGNHIEALRPLFDMIDRWNDSMKEYAAIYTGVENGLQMPHAVDDRCVCMGRFWPGCIDHGSTAWMGQLMWSYYRYTMDSNFLKNKVVPFLKGVFNVYKAMLKEVNGVFTLPLGVSAEYYSRQMNAWGENASFQLSCIHFVCEALIHSAQILKTDVELVPVWQDVRTRLPMYCKSKGKYGYEIYIWENQPLHESHRHLSHLASLYPFDLVDYHGNDDVANLFDNSLYTLAEKGMGNWAPWTYPWATIIYSRLGNGVMAEFMMQTLSRLFMKNYSTGTHFTKFSNPPGDSIRIMQLDAALSASAAFHEMMVCCIRGIVYLFNGTPESWMNVKFENILIEGAFVISAEKRDGKVKWLKIKSLAGGSLKIRNPFSSSKIRIDGELSEFNQFIELSIPIDKMITLE